MLKSGLFRQIQASRFLCFEPLYQTKSMAHFFHLTKQISFFFSNVKLFLRHNPLRCLNHKKVFVTVRAAPLFYPSYFCCFHLLKALFALPVPVAHTLALQYHSYNHNIVNKTNLIANNKHTVPPAACTLKEDWRMREVTSGLFLCF